MTQRAVVLACLVAGAAVAAGPAPLRAAAAPAQVGPAAVPGIELVPGGPADDAALAMRRWHRRYRGLIAPVLGAWAELARAAGGPRPAEAMLTGCRGLAGALAAIDRRPLLSAPDTAVALHLDETLRHLAGAADSCTRGAYFLTSWRLRRAAASWAELAARLGLYGLAP